MKKDKRNNIQDCLFRVILFLLLLSSPNLAAYSQEPGALATIDTNKILIGDQTYFRITVENKTGVTIEWPVISDSLIKGIEIIKRFLPDTLSKQNDFIRIEEKFLITSFDSGQHNLPPIKIAISSGQKHDSISTNPVTLWVSTLPVDTAKAIFDIKKPYGASLSFAEILPFIEVGVGIALLLLIIFYIIRRLKKQKPLIPSRIFVEPAHIIALRNLDMLRDAKLWQQGLIKQYYTKLTDIVRIYIEQRFEVAAMEQTSEEILASLKKMAVEDESSLVALRELLTLADFVKFAKALPLPNENESNILNAYLFVNHTKPADKAVENLSSQSEPAFVGKEVGHG